MAGLSLSGIASGVDTASIVDQLMALERQSLTKIGYRKAAVTGQQDALKEIASKLSTFKDAALALSADSTWAQKQTVESSDPTRVAVTMLAGAGIGGQSISVDRLASSAQRRFTSRPAPSTATARPRARETLTLALQQRPGAPPRHDQRRGRLDEAADRRRHQRQDRRPRGRRRGQGPRRRAARRCRRARPARTRTSRSTSTAPSSPSTATFADRRPARPPGRLPRRRRRRSSSGTRTSSSTRSPASGSRSRASPRPRPPSRSPSPRSTATAIKAKLKSFVDAYNAVVDTTRSQADRAEAQEPHERLPGRPRPALRRLGHDRHAVAAAQGHGRRGRRRPGINDLSDLGIAIPKSTGGAVSADAKAGKLVLDEAKLTAALDSDFTKVKELPRHVLQGRRDASSRPRPAATASSTTGSPAATARPSACRPRSTARTSASTPARSASRRSSRRWRSRSRTRRRRAPGSRARSPVSTRTRASSIPVRSGRLPEHVRLLAFPRHRLQGAEHPDGDPWAARRHALRRLPPLPLPGRLRHARRPACRGRRPAVAARRRSSTSC